MESSRPDRDLSLVAVALLMVTALVGCGSDAPDERTTVVRGGVLYDNWFKELNKPAPTTDHVLWATRPDTTSSMVTGADTHRCKECHGWDYKGVAGAYSMGSHRTGFAGILGVAKSEQEIFESLKTKHGYGAAGVADADLRTLATFVLKGPIDVAPLIDVTTRKFIGDASKGQPHFQGICQVCHGANGLNVQPTGSAGGFMDFPGKIANENPWEFFHKIRFGQPGAEMPGQHGLLTTPQLSDLATYAQTLPLAP